MDETWLRLRQEFLTWGMHFGELPPHAVLYDAREFLMRENNGYDSARLLWKKLKKYRPEVLYGKGYGAAPLLINLQAVAASEGYKISTLLVRDQRKETNRRRLVEGPRPRFNVKAIFIDDIINAGNTANTLEQELLAEGIRVNTVAFACLYDGVKTYTPPHGTRAIVSRGKPVESLFTRHDMGVTRVDAKRNLIKRQQWRFLPRCWGNENRPKAGPKIFKDSVFYPVDTGDVYCLDLASGEIKWKFSHQRPSHSTQDISSELVFFEDRLYYSGYDGITRCLDVNTGEPVWERCFATYQHSTAEIDPVKRCLYLNGEVQTYNPSTNTTPNNSSDISCVDIDTGDLIWRSQPTAATGPGSVKILNDQRMVVSSNDQHLRCHDRTNGRLLWAVKFEGDVKGKAGVLGNRIYAVCEKGNFQVIEFDGRVINNHRVNVKSRHQFVAVSEQHQRVLIVANDYIHCYDPNGVRQWVTTSRGSINTTGVIYKNYFLTVSDIGYVLVVDIMTGAKITTDVTGIKTNSVPYWNNEKLVIAGLRKGLYVFDTHDIEERHA